MNISEKAILKAAEQYAADPLGPIVSSALLPSTFALTDFPNSPVVAVARAIYAPESLDAGPGTEYVDTRYQITLLALTEEFGWWPVQVATRSSFLRTQREADRAANPELFRLLNLAPYSQPNSNHSKEEQ